MLLYLSLLIETKEREARSARFFRRVRRSRNEEKIETRTFHEVGKPSVNVYYYYYYCCNLRCKLQPLSARTKPVRFPDTFLAVIGRALYAELEVRGGAETYGIRERERWWCGDIVGGVSSIWCELNGQLLWPSVP